MKNPALRAVAVLLVAVAATGLAACGSKNLSGNDVAAQVQNKALTPLGITAATVKCPDKTEAKKDATIKCTVSDRDRHTGSVTVTVKNKDGDLGSFDPNVDALQLAVIEKNAEKQEPSVSQVKCPSSSKPKKGATFFCTGNIKGSGFGVVVVNQTATDSTVRVQLSKRKLNTAQIEANITKAVKKQGINAQVTCPSKVTSQKGSTFQCTVRNPANGRQLTIVATQKDDQGNFALRVKK
jgi:uncharacterized protein DUF4333